MVLRRTLLAALPLLLLLAIPILLKPEQPVAEPDKEAGKLDTMVVNERGVLLPETGGIGTLIFYLIGGILVVCSIVFIITKKRMNEK